MHATQGWQVSANHGLNRGLNRPGRNRFQKVKKLLWEMFVRCSQDDTIIDTFTRKFLLQILSYWYCNLQYNAVGIQLSYKVDRLSRKLWWKTMWTFLADLPPAADNCSTRLPMVESLLLSYATVLILSVCVARWHSSRVPDLRSTGRRFESQPPRCRLQPWAIY